MDTSRLLGGGVVQRNKTAEGPPGILPKATDNFSMTMRERAY